MIITKIALRRGRPACLPNNKTLFCHSDERKNLIVFVVFFVLRQSLTFRLLLFIVFVVFLFSSFCADRKKQRTRHKQKESLCSFVRAAYSEHSIEHRLSLQSYLFRAGCCATRFVWLYKKNYTHTALKQSRTMACSQQGFTFNF